jgi:hypothetical protein
MAWRRALTVCTALARLRTNEIRSCGEPIGGVHGISRNHYVGVVLARQGMLDEALQFSREAIAARASGQGLIWVGPAPYEAFALSAEGWRGPQPSDLSRRPVSAPVPSHAVLLESRYAHLAYRYRKELITQPLKVAWRGCTKSLKLSNDFHAGSGASHFGCGV